MVKLIAFDLDGTLLTDHKEITEKTICSLKKAQQMGIKIVPATGRPLAGVPKEVLALPAVEYAITSNGAKIIHLPTGRTVYEKLMDKNLAWNLLKSFARYDVLQEIYFQNRGYVPTEQFYKVEKYHKIEEMRKYFVETRTPVDDLEAFVDAQTGDVDKIQVLFADMSEREQAWDEVKDMPDIVPVGSLMYNIEINARGVDKGNALRRLAHMLEIPVEDTIAFGDGDNDVELVRKAGIGVAMANARPQVIEAADFVTKSNNEDGIAYALEKYVFSR